MPTAGFFIFVDECSGLHRSRYTSSYLQDSGPSRSLVLGTKVYLEHWTLDILYALSSNSHIWLEVPESGATDKYILAPVEIDKPQLWRLIVATEFSY